MNIITNPDKFHNFRYPEAYSERSKSVSVMNLNDNVRDVFVSEQNSPFFTSVNADMAQLRKYASDFGNAYSEDKMFSQATYDYILSRIGGRKSDFNALSLISKYKSFLEGIELKVFSFYFNALKNNKNSSIKDITEKALPQSYRNLTPAYLNVINNIRNIVSPLSETKSKRKTLLVLDEWCSDFHNGKLDSAIGSGKYLDILKKIKYSKKDPSIHAAIKAELDRLPAPGNDFDAFIVQYKDKTRKTLFKRLLSPFVVTIEHVIPKSRGGHANSIGNCILVRAKDNHGRKSARMLDNHPERTAFIVEYFRRVVNKINNGGMKEFQWYPFEVKKNLETETLNKINLDSELSKLKVSKEEAYRNFIA